MLAGSSWLSSMKTKGEDPMSVQAIEALLNDLQRRPDLLAELKALVPNLEAGMEWARTKGYTVSRQALAGLFESYQELSDDDLEEAAGGWSGEAGGGNPPPPPTDP
jgi:predicted ribosomally synthesized peptide with nif11-like leader